VLDPSGQDGNDETVIGEHQPEGVPRVRPGTPLGEACLRQGLEILGMFSTERPWLRVGDIARELGLSPLDAHAQVSAMHRMRLVREGPGSSYGLGTGPPDVAMDAVKATGVARRARAELIELHRRTGCPVTLAMLDGIELFVTDRGANGKEATVEMTIALDRHLPLHATALGKVLLAYLPEHHEQALAERLKLEPFTRLTITDRRALLRHLQEVRSLGLAVEDREHLPHRRCLAAPVRNADRRAIASVGIRMGELDSSLGLLLDRYSQPLLQSAAGLSQALRYARLDWPGL